MEGIGMDIKQRINKFRFCAGSTAQAEESRAAGGKSQLAGKTE